MKKWLLKLSDFIKREAVGSDLILLVMSKHYNR
jgi:hypothetical protein